MKYSLEILARSPDQYTMIWNSIKLKFPQLELIGAYDDGQVLTQQHADILVAELGMSVWGGCDVLNWMRALAIPTKVIIIGSGNTMDEVLDVWHSGAVDYIPCPCSPDELIESFAHCLTLLQSESPEKTNPTLRRQLISRLYDNHEQYHLSLTEINRDFSTHFLPGTFKLAFIKYYTSLPALTYFEQVNQLFQRIEDLAELLLAEHSNDMVFRRMEDGVLVLLNYSNDVDSIIDLQLAELFRRSKSYIENIPGLATALLISKQHILISDLPEMNYEVMSLAWSSLSLGRNSLYHFADLPAMAYAHSQQLSCLLDEIYKAINDYNIADFHAGITNLFSLPKDILSRPEMRLALRDIKKTVFTLCKHAHPQFVFDTIESRIQLNLHTAYSLDQYMEEYISQFSHLLKQCFDFRSSQGNRFIRQAILYLQDNYNTQLSLNDVAKKVGLSSVYLSALFKKETGSTFTDYLSEYRIKAAQKLLRSTNMNISEVAYAVGYSDAQYFSRIFRRFVGTNPSDYRSTFG